MPEIPSGVSRRRLLEVAGGAAAISAASGLAGADRGERVRVNVGYRTASGARAARDAASAVVREFGFDALTIELPAEAARGLARRPDVRYVEIDGQMHAIAQTLPWGVDRVDAEKVHADGETGGDNTDGEGGADIAIIDTGIDSDHPDLQANLGAGKAFVESRGPYAEPWDDDNGHGTHCAGIADAVDNTEGVVGVSTAATLHAVKVLDKNGSGSYSDVAAGIEYTADQGWDVGSLSLGGGKSSVVEDACEYAYGKGVLLVAAAGNDGPCTDCVGYPAAEPEVIAVSSTNSNDELSDFSSTGSQIELAAPGSDIYSTVPGGYDTYSGTSMACPHVSGAGGQLMDNGYTNTKARDQLGSTAEDIGLADNEQGNGLLDVEAAVSGSSDSAPSVSWVNPSDGDTVSGTITVQIDASDAEDADDTLDVTYNVDGGSSRSTSYNSTSGYYEDSLDTTQFSDGSHTFEANATDSAGNTSSASISVTTDNTESAPTVDSLSLTEVETSDDDAEFDADWAVSDDDGNLSTVDVVLTQDSDGSTEDEVLDIAVSGDSASGTTRVVADGDEGSGNSYTVEVTVTDGAGNSASDTASATESEADPAIDSLSLSEVETSDSDAEFDADWGVSDSDGDLDQVELVLTDDTDGETEDTVTVDVSGSSASGITRLVAAGDDGSGNSYTVTLTVTDTDGTATSGTASATEAETNAAPTIDSYTVTEAGSPNPHAEITADWDVSDADGNLDTVVVEVDDSDGNLVDSSTTDVSGSSASGTDEFQIKHADGQTFYVTLTVTDTAGDSATETQSVTE